MLFGPKQRVHSGRIPVHRDWPKLKLHFLTSSPMYDHIRDTYFPQITQIHKEFKKKTDSDKLSFPLGEIPQCAITAARFVTREE